MYTPGLGILPTKYFIALITNKFPCTVYIKTKIPYKQQLYLISICVIKNEVFVTFDCHTLKKLNFFLQPIWINKYLVVQILHNLTPLACTHRGSRNQVVKRLCLVTTTIKHLQNISASRRLTWRFYRGALYRGSSCTNNTKDLPICSAIQIT